MRRRVALALAVVMGTVPAVPMAQRATEGAEPLRVVSSNGVKVVLEQERSQLERSVGREIRFEFSTASSLARRIAAGEIVFDVAVLTPALIDALEDEGRILAGSPATFARTGAGIGARAGGPPADVSTLEGFRRTLLGAASVAFTDGGQSRRIIDAAFERLGITDAMGEKTLILGPGEGPTAVVAGDAELVLTLISEILPVPGLVLLGPFPEEVQDYVSFAAGIHAEATHIAAARALVRALAGPAVAAALRMHGLEPVRE